MTIPATILGITVRNQLEDRNFKITWDGSPAGYSITQYNIYRSETSYVGFVLVGITSSITLQYVDTSIPFNFDKTWYYKVTSVNSSGESDLDNTKAISDFNYKAFEKRFPPYMERYDENL